MKALAIGALLLLASCNQAASDERIADQAEDAATDAIAESPKLRDLEDRLEQAEAAATEAKAKFEAIDRQQRYILESLAQAHEGNVAATRKIDEIIENYNRHLAAYHGVQ